MNIKGFDLKMGIDARGQRLGDLLEMNAMRQKIHEACFESVLISAAMHTADLAGMNGEDRYTLLAYHALVSLEHYYQRCAQIAQLCPDPPTVPPMASRPAEGRASKVPDQATSIIQIPRPTEVKDQ